MIRLPTTLYIAFADYGDQLGIGCVDPVVDMDDAADALLQVEGTSGRNGRVLEITLDVATNQPESVRDVTEDCVRIVHRRCAERGIAAE